MDLGNFNPAQCVCVYKYYFSLDYVSKSKETSSLYNMVLSYIIEAEKPVSKEEIQAEFPALPEIILYTNSKNPNLSVQDRLGLAFPTGFALQRLLAKGSIACSMAGAMDTALRCVQLKIAQVRIPTKKRKSAHRGALLAYQCRPILNHCKKCVEVGRFSFMRVWI